MLLRALCFLALAVAAFAVSDKSKPKPTPKKPGLEQIKHVIFLMMENRSFDHYFGSLSGVRGFKDPNVQVNSADVKQGLPNVFYQHVDSALTNKTNHLLPFYMNARGGDTFEATQCATGGTNSLEKNLAANNEDLNNIWPVQNTPYSMAYFRRNDLPIHYSIVDHWTVADHHAEAMVAATHPNRCIMFSGSAGILGGNVPPGLGGPVMDDNEFPGGEKIGISDATWNVFPYKWKTTADYLEAAGVSWHVYQPNANLVDNGFFYFDEFQKAARQVPPGPLAMKALTVSGPTQLSFVDQFKADAMAGKLAAVTYIVPQDQLTEHPPKRPRDGGWHQREIIDALVNSPSYKDSALFITYDETGGFYDHVTPFHSPDFTGGEWLQNPFTLKNSFAGPGFRVPSYVISPYTRGGNVFTEKCDHTSNIFFLENWVKETMGKDIFSREINDWRREHMCDFTNIFDFAHPDFSAPKIPEAAFPHFDNATNMFDGDVVCDAQFPDHQPEIPYGEQKPGDALWTESGYRPVRGILTEGRYLVFQEPGSSKRGLAVSNTRGHSSLGSSSVPTRKESDPALRFIIYPESIFPEAKFQIRSAFLEESSGYLNSDLEFTSKSRAATFSIAYNADGTSYSIQVESSRKYISMDRGGKVSLSSSPFDFLVFSVTF